MGGGTTKRERLGFLGMGHAPCNTVCCGAPRTWAEDLSVIIKI